MYSLSVYGAVLYLCVDHDRVVAKTEGSTNTVRVATRENKVVQDTFVFNPCKKDAEADCIMGHGGKIRIPLGVKEWKDVGPGSHVRVTFLDGFNYLAVIAYPSQIDGKDWHIFFEDGDEFDIEVQIWLFVQ